MIRKLKAFLLIFFICAGIVFVFPKNSFILAQEATPTPTPDTEKQNKLRNEIKELEKRITELQGQSKTLSSQISVMDSNIRLTQLRIQSTQEELRVLIADISTATKKISVLEESLNDLTEVLLNRIIATYQIGSAQPFSVLLSSNNISDFMVRANYLRIVQEQDKKIIYQTQQAKNDYTHQKEIFQQKKEKVETLKKQLEDYKTQLDIQKNEKEALLAATKNSEKEYQRRLQAALAEMAAINQITSGYAVTVSVGPVKEGDVIAHVIQGVSPCSTGTHLHFEVRNSNNSLYDPASYLSSKSVNFLNSPDSPFSFSGSWNWPLSDTVYITQGYGMTWYARPGGSYQSGAYGGGPHTGIDMYSNSSSEVRAVKEGELFRGSVKCGGGNLLFAKINHTDGTQTLYLHVQP